MEIFVFWVVFAIVVGVIASSRGRNGFGWFLLAVIISPLLAVLLIALLPSLAAAPGAPTPDTHVKCAECAELILREAKKCKHCGSMVTPQPLQSASSGPYSDLLVVEDAPAQGAASDRTVDLAARATSRFSRFSRP